MSRQSRAERRAFAERVRAAEGQLRLVGGRERMTAAVAALPGARVLPSLRRNDPKRLVAIRTEGGTVFVTLEPYGGSTLVTVSVHEPRSERPIQVARDVRARLAQFPAAPPRERHAGGVTSLGGYRPPGYHF